MYIKPHISQNDSKNVIVQVNYAENINEVRKSQFSIDSNTSIWELKKLIANHLSFNPQNLEYSFQNLYGINSNKINSLPLSKITDETEIKIRVERKKYKNQEKSNNLKKKIRLTERAIILLSRIFQMINSSGFIDYPNAEYYFKKVIGLRSNTLTEAIDEFLKFAHRRDEGLNEEDFREYIKTLFLNDESEANSHFTKIKEFLKYEEKEEENKPYIQVEKIKIHMLPRYFLSNSADYFETLMAFVNQKYLNQNLKQKFWNLIISLFTNKRLEFLIKGKLINKDFSRTRLFTSDNIYLSTYILSIIENLFLEDNNLNKKWICNFFEKSGLNYLIESIKIFFKNSDEINFKFISKSLYIINLFLFKYLSENNYSNPKAYKEVRKEYGDCTISRISLNEKFHLLKISLKPLELVDIKKLQKNLCLNDINNILYLTFCYILEAGQNLKNEIRNVANIVEMKKVAEIAFTQLELKSYLPFSLKSLTQSQEFAKVK